MNFSFPQYLLAKQTVDDRALNKDVVNALKANLPQQPFRTIEVGAGIGTMLRRLVRWDVIRQAEYLMVDEMAENVEYASVWIEEWAKETGLSVERGGQSQVRIFDEMHDIQVTFERADVFDFIQVNENPADLLIAHAFLDLLPMPESLPKLFSLTRDPSTGPIGQSGRALAWLTLNFDGVTTFEPTIDAALEAQIERLYHETMDSRTTGGDSRSGRHLFNHLNITGARILAAGASDWVVHPTDGMYPDEEAYFLHFILHFFEESLAGHAHLDQEAFTKWIRRRRAQIESGELVYIAHQMDFLAKI